MVGDLSWSSALDGCPGADHFDWWLGAWHEAAGPVDPDELSGHILITEDYPADRVSRAFVAPDTRQAVVEVLTWRMSRDGGPVVTYRGADDRRYDLAAWVDPATGLLARAKHSRSANGIDVISRRISELTRDDLNNVHAVFETAYRNADHGFLNRRLSGLATIGMAWRDESMLGFVASGLTEVDLPIIGRHTFLDGGLTCIIPSAQGVGALGTITSAKARTFESWPREGIVNHFGTPVTLRAALGFRAIWPGSTIAEVARSMASPTATQRAVGAALADVAGADSYDAEHWVIRSGNPAGDSTTDPVDLEPEYAQLFSHVDRSQGDTLLGVLWETPPPPEWWE